MIWSLHVDEDKYCVRLAPVSLVDGHHRFGKLYCVYLQEISRVIRKMDVCTQYADQSHEWGSGRWRPRAPVALPFVSACIIAFGKMQKFWRQSQRILHKCLCHLTQTTWNIPDYGVNWQADQFIGDSLYLIHLYHQHYLAAYICSAAHNSYWVTGCKITSYEWHMCGDIMSLWKVAETSHDKIFAIPFCQ